MDGQVVGCDNGSSWSREGWQLRGSSDRSDPGCGATSSWLTPRNVSLRSAWLAAPTRVRVHWREWRPGSPVGRTSRHLRGSSSRDPVRAIPFGLTDLPSFTHRQRQRGVLARLLGCTKKEGACRKRPTASSRPKQARVRTWPLPACSRFGPSPGWFRGSALCWRLGARSVCGRSPGVARRPWFSWAG